MDSYDEITDILREIESAVKLRDVFISGSAHEFNGSWDKESAEKFARELASALVKNNYRITSGYGLGIGSAIINGALDEIYSSKYKHIDEYLCLRPFPQNYSSEEEKEKRNTQYREDMISNVGIAIFIFGNKIISNSGTKGIINSDGCKKEFEIAVKKGKIVIPIGSTGYMAKELLDYISEHLEDYDYLKDFISELYTETEINKLVALILKIIEKQQVI